MSSNVSGGNVGRSEGRGSTLRGNIVRYTVGERTNHWIVAIAFILAALSGLAMFHPALFWLSDLFGGGPWTRVLHPFLGLVMVIGLWRDVVNNREERLPEVGRFNAGQKLLLLVLALCLAGLFLSGFVIWRTYFAFYFPIPVIRLAALVHAVCAFVLITAIIVHIYAGIWVKNSMSAMTRGTVSPGWAWKHHRAWFREVINAARSRPGPN
ncbi:MAG: formate dehydrogenase cytochrome b556 subunit [Gammaproteobacteria bacterium]|nr:MAG: formate dehydrogenase cytochrome b556 subunit [Gammaproteobacteria bacterium]